eukprot:gene41406-54891_t
MSVSNYSAAFGDNHAQNFLFKPTAADGYMLALGSPMELVLAPMAIQGVKYKPEDFKLVAQFATTNTILAVRTSLNIKSVDELVAHAKKNPNTPLSYGSVGH